jgi:Uma2 family endonuclease
MTTVVESPLIPARSAELWPVSVEAYRLLGEAGLIPKNTELLYGFVYKKMSKSPLHSTLVRRMVYLLNRLAAPGFFVDSEQPLRCGDSEPEPDVAVIRGSRNDFEKEHPQTAELIVEICVSSHEYDLTKLRAYSSAGVKECWFVLGAEKRVEVYREPDGEGYRQRSLFGPDGAIQSSVFQNRAILLEEVFIAS